MLFVKNYNNTLFSFFLKHRNTMGADSFRGRTGETFDTGERLFSRHEIRRPETISVGGELCKGETLFHDIAAHGNRRS